MAVVVVVVVVESSGHMQQQQVHVVLLLLHPPSGKDSWPRLNITHTCSCLGEERAVLVERRRCAHACWCQPDGGRKGTHSL